MKNKNILIVEDEKVLLDLYYTILTRSNFNNKYKVYTASSAKEAISHTERTEFDIILTDYHLPVEDGITLIKKIRTKSPYTKFIIISGYLSHHIVQSALAAGAWTCLKKPCSINTIISTVESALSHKEEQEIEIKQIQDVLESYPHKALFINPQKEILCSNNVFRESNKDVIKKKCFDMLGSDALVCSNCPLTTPENINTTQFIKQKTKSNTGKIVSVNEHIEPWRNHEGRVLGFLISVYPLSKKDFIMIKEPSVPKKEIFLSEFLVFAINKKGKIVFADNTFSKYCQEKTEEIMGKHINNYLHSYFIQYLKKQETSFVEFAKNNLNRQVKLDFIQQQSGKRCTLRCEFRAKNACTPSDWEITAICVDEEKTNQLSRLIEFEKESSKQFISGQFDMVITLDKDYKIKTINNACLKMLNAKKSELVDSDILDLLFKDQDRASFNQALTQVQTLKDVYNLRLDICHNNRKKSTLANLSSVCDSFNDEIGYVLVLRDIENELKMEATLSSIERMQALGQLAAGTAHQINNYTNTITGSGELLALCIQEALGNDNKVLAEIQDFLDIINSSLARLTALAKNLTNFARSQQAPVISPGNINKVVKDSLSLISANILRNSIDLTTSFNEKIPPTYISPLHLEQAIINILMNAIDAVKDKKGKIAVSTYKETSFVCIKIEDNGPGIPAEVKDHIFEAFVTTKPSGVGTGLGLNVAKGVIDTLKGNIEIDSSPDNGTKVIIKIPLLSKKNIM